MKFISILLLLLAVCLTANVQAEESSAEPALTLDGIRKMPIKKLRQFLAARGLECKGCAEKDDFVKMAFENKDAPLSTKPEVDTSSSSSGDEPNPELKKKEIDDIMASLRSSGLGDGIKMFTKDDFAGLSPEQMAAKFGEGGGGGGRGGRGKSRGGGKGKTSGSSRSTGSGKKPTSKPAKKLKEEEGEHIEL